MNTIRKYEDCDVALMIHALNGALDLEYAAFLCQRSADYLSALEAHIISIERELVFWRNESKLTGTEYKPKKESNPL